MVKNGGFLPLVRYITRSGRTHKGKDFDLVISPQVDRRSGVKRGSEGIPYDRAARHMQIFIEHSKHASLQMTHSSKERRRLTVLHRSRFLHLNFRFARASRPL